MGIEAITRQDREYRLTNEELDIEASYCSWASEQLELFEALGPGSFHELTRRSGLSRSTVSGVLQGKRGASLETLRKLNEASGVELGKLVEYVERQRKGRNK